MSEAAAWKKQTMSNITQTSDRDARSRVKFWDRVSKDFRNGDLARVAIRFMCRCITDDESPAAGGLFGEYERLIEDNGYQSADSADDGWTSQKLSRASQ